MQLICQKNKIESLAPLPDQYFYFTLAFDYALRMNEFIGTSYLRNI